MYFTRRRWANPSASLLCAISGLLLIPIGREAVAQVDSPEARRQFCERAASELMERPARADAKTSARFNRGLVEIQSCPDEGPGVLAAIWRTPPGDSATLALLQGVTAHLRDRSLVELSSQIAQDFARPTEVRLAAIGVLVTYYDSTLAAVFPNPGVQAQPRDYVRLAWQTDPIAIKGRQPLIRAETNKLVLEVLARLASGDADDRVRKSAQYLVHYFKYGW